MIRFWALLIWSSIVLAACGVAGSASIPTSTPPPSPTIERATATETPDYSPTPSPDATVLSDELATPTASAANTEQIMDSAGFAFQPVPGWLLEIHENVATMSQPDMTPTANLVIVLTGGTLEQLNIEGVSGSSIETIDDFFEALVKSLEQESPEITLEATEDRTIGGHSGRLARFQGSTGFADIETAAGGYIAATLPDENRAFVLFGLASPPDLCQCDAEISTVLDSIRFLEAEE
jgi:hypothetical protein